MARRLVGALLSFLLLLTSQLPSYSDSESEAKKLYDEAIQLFALAKKAEPTSYQQASEYLSQVLDRLESVRSEFSASQVAFKLSLGELKVGDYTVQELKEVLPELVKAASVEKGVEEDNRKASVFIIGHVSNMSGLDTEFRAEVSMELARLNAQMERFGEALQIAERIPTKLHIGPYNTKSTNLRYKAKRAIVEGYIKSGQIDKAIHVAAKIDNSSQQAGALEDIITASIEESNFDQACDAARVPRIDYYRLGFLIKIAESCIDSGQIEKAKQILLEANQYFRQTMNTLIYLNATQGARKIVDLAEAYIHMGWTQESEEILDYMYKECVKRRWGRIPQKDRLEIRSSIALAYQKAGNHMKALEQLKELKLFARRDDSPEVVHKLKQEIAKLCLKAEMVAEADLLLAGILSESEGKINKKDIWLIAEIYIKAGQPDKASQILADPAIDKKSVPNIRQLLGIAKAYIEAGESDKASQILADLAIDKKSSSNIRPLLEIVEAYIEAGESDKASQSLLRTLQLANTYNDFIAVARIYVNLGQIQKAEALFERAISKATQISGPYRVRTLVSIARIYVDAGRDEKVDDILAEILRLSKEADSEDNSQVITETIGIVRSYKSKGQNQKAQEVLSKIRILKGAELLSGRLLPEYIGVQDFASAFDIAISMRGRYKYHNMVHIARARTSAGLGDVEGTIQILLDVYRSVSADRVKYINTDGRYGYLSKADKVNILLGIANSWIELAPECSKKTSMEFLHDIIGTNLSQADNTG